MGQHIDAEKRWRRLHYVSFVETKYGCTHSHSVHSQHVIQPTKTETKTETIVETEIHL